MNQNVHRFTGKQSDAIQYKIFAVFLKLFNWVLNDGEGNVIRGK